MTEKLSKPLNKNEVPHPESMGHADMEGKKTAEADRLFMAFALRK